MKTKNFFVRFTIWFVIFSFILTNHSFVYAEPTQNRVQVSTAFPEVANVEVPQKWGTIQDSYQAQGKQAVILIQDAHAIPDAQESIYQLIAHFQKEYGLRSVAFEGAANPMETLPLQSFPDRNLLKEVFEDYQNQGELTGTLKANLWLDPSMEFYGVEDWSLYEKGLGFYLQAAEEAQNLSRLLEAQEKDLEVQKQKVYSKELLEIDRLQTQFEKRPESLMEILLALKDDQRPKEGTELSKLWMHVRLEQERDAAIEAEVRDLTQKAKKQMTLASLSSRDRARFHEKLQAYQTSQLSASQWITYLVDLPFDLSPSDELEERIQIQRQIDHLNGLLVMQDLERHFTSIHQRLFENDRQRELYELSQQLKLQKRFMALKLSRQDWENIKTLDFEAAKKFYQNAVAREDAFVDRLKLSDQPTLLVAGGFHAEGITERLKARGISYVSILPHIPAIPEKINYEKQMTGQFSWSSYFEIENGKIDLYKAFMRSARDALIAKSGPKILKPWRDQIIRNLARQDRLVETRNYTKWIDELTLSTQPDLRKKWRQNADAFISQLRELQSQGNLNKQNILNLGLPANISSLDHAKTTQASIRVGSNLQWLGDRLSAIVPFATKSEVRNLDESIPIPTANQMLEMFRQIGFVDFFKGVVRSYAEGYQESIWPSTIATPQDNRGIWYTDRMSQNGAFVEIYNVEGLSVIGDLHGNYKGLQFILEDIAEQLAANPNWHLVITGDAIHTIREKFLIDKRAYLKSYIALLTILAFKQMFPRQVHYGVGNHDLSHLRGYTDILGRNVWGKTIDDYETAGVMDEGGNNFVDISDDDERPDVVRQNQLFDHVVREEFKDIFSGDSIDYHKELVEKYLPVGIRLHTKGGSTILITHTVGPGNFNSDEDLVEAKHYPEMLDGFTAYRNFDPQFLESQRKRASADLWIVGHTLTGDKDAKRHGFQTYKIEGPSDAWSRNLGFQDRFLIADATISAPYFNFDLTNPLPFSGDDVLTTEILANWKNPDGSSPFQIASRSELRETMVPAPLKETDVSIPSEIMTPRENAERLLFLQMPRDGSFVELYVHKPNLVTREYFLLRTNPAEGEIREWIGGIVFNRGLFGNMIGHYGEGTAFPLNMRPDRGEHLNKTIGFKIARRHRTQGFGKLLVDVALKDLKERGYRQVKLVEATEGSQRLFDRIGFQRVGQIKQALYGGVSYEVRLKPGLFNTGQTTLPTSRLREFSISETMLQSYQENLEDFSRSEVRVPISVKLRNAIPIMEDQKIGKVISLQEFWKEDLTHEEKSELLHEIQKIHKTATDNQPNDDVQDLAVRMMRNRLTLLFIDLKGKIQIVQSTNKIDESSSSVKVRQSYSLRKQDHTDEHGKLMMDSFLRVFSNRGFELMEVKVLADEVEAYEEYFREVNIHVIDIVKHGERATLTLNIVDYRRRKTSAEKESDMIVFRGSISPQTSGETAIGSSVIVSLDQEQEDIADDPTPPAERFQIKLFESILNLQYGFTLHNEITDEIAILEGRKVKDIYLSILLEDASILKINDLIREGMSAEEAIDEALAPHRESIQRMEGKDDPMGIMEGLKEINFMITEVGSVEMKKRDFIYSKDALGLDVSQKMLEEREVHSKVLGQTVVKTGVPSIDIEGVSFLAYFNDYINQEISDGRPIAYSVSKFLHELYQKRKELNANLKFIDLITIEVFEFLQIYYQYAKVEENKRKDSAQQQSSVESVENNIVLFVPNIKSDVQFGRILTRYQHLGRIVGIVEQTSGSKAKNRVYHHIITAEALGMVYVNNVDFDFKELPENAATVVSSEEGGLVMVNVDEQTEKHYLTQEKNRLLYEEFFQSQLQRFGLPIVNGKPFYYLYDTVSLSQAKGGAESVLAKNGGQGIGLFRLEDYFLYETTNYDTGAGFINDMGKVMDAVSESVVVLVKDQPDFLPQLTIRVVDAASARDDVDADKYPHFLRDEMDSTEAQKYLQNHSNIRLYIDAEEYPQFREQGKNQLKGLFAAYLARVEAEKAPIKFQILLPNILHSEEIGKIETWIFEAKEEFIESLGYDDDQSRRAREIIDGIGIGYMTEEVPGVERSSFIYNEIQKLGEFRSNFIGIGSNDLADSTAEAYPDEVGRIDQLTPGLVEQITKVAREAYEKGLPVALEGEWGGSSKMALVLAMLRIIDVERYFIVPVASPKKPPRLYEMVRWISEKQESTRVRELRSYLERIIKGEDLPNFEEFDSLLITLERQFNADVPQGLHFQIFEGSNRRSEMRQPRDAVSFNEILEIQDKLEDIEARLKDFQGKESEEFPEVFVAKKLIDEKQIYDYFMTTLGMIDRSEILLEEFDELIEKFTKEILRREKTDKPVPQENQEYILAMEVLINRLRSTAVVLRGDYDEINEKAEAYQGIHSSKRSEEREDVKVDVTDILAGQEVENLTVAQLREVVEDFRLKHPTIEDFELISRAPYEELQDGRYDVLFPVIGRWTPVDAQPTDLNKDRASESNDDRYMVMIRQMSMLLQFVTSDVTAFEAFQLDEGEQVFRLFHQLRTSDAVLDFLDEEDRQIEFMRTRTLAGDRKPLPEAHFSVRFDPTHQVIHLERTVTYLPPRPLSSRSEVRGMSLNEEAQQILQGRAVSDLSLQQLLIIIAELSSQVDPTHSGFRLEYLDEGPALQKVEEVDTKSKRIDQLVRQISRLIENVNHYLDSDIWDFYKGLGVSTEVSNQIRIAYRHYFYKLSHTFNATESEFENFGKLLGIRKTLKQFVLGFEALKHLREGKVQYIKGRTKVAGGEGASYRFLFEHKDKTYRALIVLRHEAGKHDARYSIDVWPHGVYDAHKPENRIVSFRMDYVRDKGEHNGTFVDPFSADLESFLPSLESPRHREIADLKNPQQFSHFVRRLDERIRPLLGLPPRYRSEVRQSSLGIQLPIEQRLLTNTTAVYYGSGADGASVSRIVNEYPSVEKIVYIDNGYNKEFSFSSYRYNSILDQFKRLGIQIEGDGHQKIERGEFDSNSRLQVDIKVPLSSGEMREVQFVMYGKDYFDPSFEQGLQEAPDGFGFTLVSRPSNGGNVDSKFLNLILDQTAESGLIYVTDTNLRERGNFSEQTVELLDTSDDEQRILNWSQNDSNPIFITPHKYALFRKLPRSEVRASPLYVQLPTDQEPLPNQTAVYYGAREDVYALKDLVQKFPDLEKIVFVSFSYHLKTIEEYLAKKEIEVEEVDGLKLHERTFDEDDRLQVSLKVPLQNEESTDVELVFYRHDYHKMPESFYRREAPDGFGLTLIKRPADRAEADDRLMALAFRETAENGIVLVTDTNFTSFAFLDESYVEVLDSTEKVDSLIEDWRRRNEIYQAAKKRHDDAQAQWADLEKSNSNESNDDMTQILSGEKLDLLGIVWESTEQMNENHTYKEYFIDSKEHLLLRKKSRSEVRAKPYGLAPQNTFKAGRFEMRDISESFARFVAPVEVRDQVRQGNLDSRFAESIVETDPTEAEWNEIAQGVYDSIDQLLSEIEQMDEQTVTSLEPYKQALVAIRKTAEQFFNEKGVKDKKTSIAIQLENGRAQGLPSIPAHIHTGILKEMSGLLGDLLLVKSDAHPIGKEWSDLPDYGLNIRVLKTRDVRNILSLDTNQALGMIGEAETYFDHRIIPLSVAGDIEKVHPINAEVIARLVTLMAVLISYEPNAKLLKKSPKDFLARYHLLKPLLGDSGFQYGFDQNGRPSVTFFIDIIQTKLREEAFAKSA